MTKAVDEFINGADRRFAALQKLIDTQRGEIVELSRAFGDLAEASSKQRKAIEALQAELAQVKQASSRHMPDVAPVEAKRSDGVGATREERGVSISVGEPVASNMPTKGELRRLLQIVAARYSQFANVPEELFSGAFRFIQSCSRTDKLDGHAIGYWLEEAAAFSHNHDINAHALVASVIAAGDIKFTDPSNPWFSSFALHRHGPNTGKTAWRDVLSGGGILAHQFRHRSTVLWDTCARSGRRNNIQSAVVTTADALAGDWRRAPSNMSPAFFVLKEFR
jgi:hypothetical protein